MTFTACFTVSIIYLPVGTALVGTYAAQTPTGLHNMLGNVWEWVEFSEKRKRKGRSARTESNQRALRGGSFIDSYVSTLCYVAFAYTALFISSRYIITFSSFNSAASTGASTMLCM
jgi:Sulfatase-modifying factor enzyme 1